MKKQRRTRGCPCWVSRSVERALGGGRKTGDRQLHKCHTSPAKISWGTQQRSGLETGSLGQRTCQTRLRERLGEARRPWTPAVSGVISPGRPTLIPYLCPYSCQGGRRTQRELSHGTILEKEAWVGGRKENTGEMVRSLSRCNVPFLPGLQSFPVWSFKSRECLGKSFFCWALAGMFPWPLMEGPF